MLERLRSLWYRLSSRRRRQELDAELAEELALHAELLSEEMARIGVAAQDLPHAVAMRLGNSTIIHERTRAHWSLGWVDALAQDGRYALRFLRRSPGFTAVAVLSLALGIGANATVFSVADRILFKAPHIDDPDRLYLLNVRREYEGTGPRPFHAAVTIPEYLALRGQARSIASIALSVGPDRVKLGRGPDAERIKESVVSTNFFEVLGVRPILGRVFQDDDDDPARPDRAAVISYGFWKRRFDGADDVIGKRFTASKLDFVVIGVTPRGFSGADVDAADVWAPIGAVGADRIDPDWQHWDGYSPHVVVRLHDSVTVAAASAEATVILGRIQEARGKGQRKSVALGPILEAHGPAEQPGEVAVSTRLVLASAAVLLVACANLANLLLVRALTRRREIALRLAVGVSRSRLVMQMLLEAFILALIGAVAALLATYWSGSALRTLVFPDVQWADGVISARVLAFAVLTAFAVAAIATAAPAVRMTRADVGSALRSAAPQLTASTGPLRRALIVVQVALSMLLIIGAITFGRSLSRAYAFDMGLDVSRVVTARFSLETDSVSLASRMVLLQQAARAVRTIPGVELATATRVIPLTGNTVLPLAIPERDLPPRTFAAIWHVTPELQRIAGFRLVRGRWIDDGDVQAGMVPPILVSETAARHLWPNADAVGRCIRIGGAPACQRVVGVIRDLRQYSIRDEPEITMLIGESAPTIDEFQGGYVVARVRDGVPPASLVPSIRSVMKSVHPDLASVDVRPLAQSLEGDYRPLRLGAATFSGFALLAIILAGVGLYGVLAFSVVMRTGEFGIRAALGARAGHLVRSATGEGLAVVTIGVVAGMALSWFASSAITSVLFETTARETPPYAIAAGVLALVAVAACSIPAWRATRVDPAIALRAE